jgi:GT2 family glycosyltransferase
LDDSISVIICTNRPGRLIEAVRSVLANPQHFELCVVAQGGTWAAEELAPIADSRLRVVADPGTGLSHARNIGLTASTGELILFTDDDCLVASDWVDAHLKCYRESPDAVMVFGLVEAPNWYTGADGTVPTFDPRAAQGTPRNDRGIVLGIGANMSLRRSCLEKIGVFDETLGAGGSLCSGEDADLSLRASAAGLLVLADRRPSVVHEGGVRRYGAEAKQLWWRDGIGLGAVSAKRLRSRDLNGAFAVFGSLNLLNLYVVRAFVAGRRPLGFNAAATLSLGAMKGFAMGLLSR